MKWFIGIIGIVSIAMCMICAAVCVADFANSVAEIFRKKGA